MKPEGVSIHAHRIKSLEVTPESLKNMKLSIERIAEELVSSLVNVLLYACTSGSFIGGKEWEQDIIKKMEKSSGIPAITTSGAVIKALRTLKVKKIVMATPYTDLINSKEKAFLESCGLRVLNMNGLQKVINTEIGALQPQEAYNLAKQVFIPEAEAVFISCTDFRTIEIIEKLETELHIPVISSNQASFWQALRCCGINDQLKKMGTLFKYQLKMNKAIN
jgi:maleate isomerase